MGSNSIPPKTPSDESINRGLVCAHMHFIARTQKILTFTKTECDYLNGWIKKRSHTQKSHPKSGEPHRYKLGNVKKKEEKKDESISVHTCIPSHGLKRS